MIPADPTEGLPFPARLMQTNEALLAENLRLRGIIEAVKAYPYIPKGLADLVESMEKAG